MTVIDDYLKKVEISKRKQLERIRFIAKKIVPDSEEVISYGIPTLRYKGHSFLGFAAYKEHIGIYPYSGDTVEKLQNILHEYQTFKGTIRVPFDQPISEDILKQIIVYRISKIESQHSVKKR